jgi:hypothetical protein
VRICASRGPSLTVTFVVRVAGSAMCVKMGARVHGCDAACQHYNPLSPMIKLHNVSWHIGSARFDTGALSGEELVLCLKGKA